MSKNDELFDAIVKLSIQLTQHERQVEGEVNKRLSRLSDRLDQLVDTYPYMTAVRRIEGEFLYLIMEVSRQIGDTVTGKGRRIIEQQSREIQRIIEEMEEESPTLPIGVPLMLGGIALNGLMGSAALDTARNTIVHGNTLNVTLNRMSASSAVRFRQALEQAVAEHVTMLTSDPNVSISDITQKQKSALKRALREAVSEPGFTNIRRSMSDISSGILNAMFNNGLTTLVSNNRHIFKTEWLWSAVLDTRLCYRCLSRHGTLTTDTAPLHPRCRCITVPVISTEDPAAVVDFEEWFNRQSNVYKRQVLGSRFDDYASGRLSIRNFVTLRNNMET